MRSEMAWLETAARYFLVTTIQIREERAYHQVSRMIRLVLKGVAEEIAWERVWMACLYPLEAGQMLHRLISNHHLCLPPDYRKPQLHHLLCLALVAASPAPEPIRLRPDPHSLHHLRFRQAHLRICGSLIVSQIFIWSTTSSLQRRKILRPLMFSAR
jgi:hypothetical protein